ncbi:MAG: hypothetical protein ACT4P3_21175 [Betaproteobacteria bacterium]
MAETNPRFATEDDDSFFMPMPSWRPRSVSQKPQSAAPHRARFVVDLSSGVLTMVEEPEALELEIEHAYPAMTSILKAYLPETHGAEYLTVDDIASWERASYEQRRFAASQVAAFSNTEALREKSGPDLLKHLSRYLRSIFRPAYGLALADRVEALSRMVLEEAGGELNLSGESLENLIAFLEANTKLSRPSLVAGPSGELIAIWKGAKQGEFTVRFMPDGTVRYLLTKTNRKHPKGVSRVSGDTTPDKLFDEARLSELRWMVNQ